MLHGFADDFQIPNNGIDRTKIIAKFFLGITGCIGLYARNREKNVV